MKQLVDKDGMRYSLDPSCDHDGQTEASVRPDGGVYVIMRCNKCWGISEHLVPPLGSDDDEQTTAEEG